MSLKINKILIVTICRILVGVVFLLSGFAKAIDLDSFSALITQYGFGNIAWLAPIIVLTETILGLCLLLNIYAKKATLATIAITIIFSGAFCYAFFVHGIADCGCFGKINRLNLSPSFTLVRNIILILLLLFYWRFAPNQQTVLPAKKYQIACIFLALFCFFMGNSYLKKPKSKHHPMFERPVSETILPELMHMSPDSTYIVFMFSYKCQSCWNYFENIKRYYNSDIADKIVVFAEGKDSLNAFKNFFIPEFDIMEKDNGILTQLTSISPTMFYIDNDTIKYVIEGQIPSLYLFERNYLEIK